MMDDGQSIIRYKMMDDGHSIIRYKMMDYSQNKIGKIQDDLSKLKGGFTSNVMSEEVVHLIGFRRKKIVYILLSGHYFLLFEIIL